MYLHILYNYEFASRAIKLVIIDDSAIVLLRNG